MSFRKLARSLALLALLPLGLTTCGGASFDDPSLIKGLRVLAVQKSSPYPKPGEEVKLKLLFWDGKSTEDNPRNLFVALLPNPCENPKGDLYYNCLTQLVGTPGGGSDAADAGATDGGAPDDGGTPRSAPAARGELLRAARPEQGSLLHDINHTREATVRLSADIIANHAVTPGVPPYGLAYVLFLACAGMPRPVPNAGPNALPFGCFDADGRQLGADDFVIGYTSMYAYADRVNNNPVIDDFLLDAASLAESTTDETRVLHIPSCKESDRTKCPKHPLKPAINRALTVEKDDDPSARTPDGQQLEEQAWVTYYITAGELKSSLRLVNDATRGWNEQNGTEYTAPAEPGPVRLFAVVHDNRGGVAWVEGKIIVD
jgi:hypothetical protein